MVVELNISTFMILTHTLHQDVLDVELCTYALTLVNKTLYEIDDQPTFYDQTDFMEDLGIDRLVFKIKEYKDDHYPG